MYTHRRLRHATRWNRRFAFALAILLLLALSWSAYGAWLRSQPHAPEQRGQLAYR
jgi:hypothetical protein